MLPALDRPEFPLHNNAAELAAVHAVSEKSFLLPMQRDPTLPVGESITHRTYLTVVDKHGEVRGYYDGESDAGIEAALARARFLAQSP